MARRKPYTFRTVIWDLFWLLVTGGLWAVWMILRELRLRP